MENESFVQTKKLSILEGIAYNGVFILTQGFLLTGLALQFNVSEKILAILGVIPMLSQMFQIFSPKLLRLAKSRKKAMLISASIARPLFLIIPILLTLNLRNQYLLLFIMLIFGAFNSLTGNFWVSIMRDIVSQESSGRFFGVRNLLISLFSMVMIYFYSWIIDSMGESAGFITITIIGSIFSLSSYFMLRKYEDPPKKEYLTGNIFKEAFSDENFKKFIIFSFFWNFTIAISGPFFPYHQIINLKLDYSYMSILAFIATGISMFFYIIWGKISDKIGHQSVAEFSVFLASLVSFIWVFMNPLTQGYLLVIDAFITGLAWSGINLTLFTIMLGIVNPGNVEAYFAVLSLTNGIGALTGSLIGGLSATLLKDIYFEIGGMPFYGIQFLFLTSGILRAISWLLLKKVKTRKEVSVPGYFFNALYIVGRRAVSRPYEYASILAKTGRQLKKKIFKKKSIKPQK